MGETIKITSIAVFCGSKKVNDEIYERHAKLLGELIARNGITLIYGGGRRGLMGNVADAVMEEGGNVIGIIPHLLVQRERQHNQITELIVADDMHDRKRQIYARCDAAVILAGGLGTLDELFEMLTWNQLSIHNKQVFVVNTKGFYSHLLAHIDHIGAEGFLDGPAKKKITVLNDPLQLLQYL